MRIALAQIQSGTDPTANLDVVADYTRRAAEAGARVVLFPEATMCRFGVPLKPVAEPLDGPWASGVRAVAERAGIVVVAGMFCPSDDGRVTNTLIPPVRASTSTTTRSISTTPSDSLNPARSHPVSIR